MLLAIDVGNTHTVIGLFDHDQLKQHWRLETQRERTADELGVLLLELFRVSGEQVDIDGIIIANVVPPLQHALQRLGERYFKTQPVFVDTRMDCGIRIKLDNPEEIGADRLVNAVAARHHVGQSAVIVVDFGTATTFDFINEVGDYIGGAIAPGILSSNEALSKKASQLPRTDIRRPEKVVGTNTRESMQSGLYYGYVGLVDGLVDRIRSSVKVDPQVIATGGLAGLISQESTTIQEVLPNLTLDGLYLIWQRLQN